MADEIPNFSFTEEEIANIKASVGAVDVDESQETPVDEVRPKQRRTPKRSSKPVSESEDTIDSPSLKSPAIPLTRREEKEVAARLANILAGFTGMGGVVKPYIPMTDDEATAIAEPLASYLIRNEPTSGIAREILENYDIVAMMLGVGSYGVRVYSDRKRELATNRPNNTEAMERIQESQTSSNGRGPDEGASTIISVPDATRSGSAPFDI